MLSMNHDEQEWLNSYQGELKKQFPGVVQQFIIYGSKARGDFHADSDLDIVLVVTETDWKIKQQIQYLGYELSIGKDVLPSLMIFDQGEWNKLKDMQSIYQEEVEKDGVRV